MIDYATIQLKPGEEGYRKFCDRIGAGFNIDAPKIQTKYYNLRFTYYPNSGILKIQNSFHKFYNQCFLGIDGNHTDFSLQNFHAACHYLFDGLLEHDIKDTWVSAKTEFGINVDSSPHHPFFLISKWLSHQVTHINEFFTIPPFSGKPSQRTAYGSDYKIKVYHKKVSPIQLQGAVQKPNLLRYEIVITEIRKLRRILACDEITVATLLEPQAWGLLFNFLLSTYQQVRKIPQLSSSVITEQHLNQLYRYCNPLMRKDLQEMMSKHHFNKLNASNRQVYEMYDNSSDNFFNELFERIKSKECILINSQSNFTSCNKQ